MLNRRDAIGLVAKLAAGIAVVAALPSVEPVADPVEAATAELVLASVTVDAASPIGTRAFGDALVAWVKLCVRLHERLVAEYGDDLGAAIWKRAMDRHYDWYCDLHDLDRPRRG